MSGVRFRSPFPPEEAVGKLEAIREMVIWDCMRHLDECEEDVPTFDLRVELLCLVDRLCVAHGGRVLDEQLVAVRH